MRIVFALIGILCIFFLIIPVAANDLANSTIITSKQWVVANGNDQSTITVTAIDSNHVPQSGIPVTFTLDPSSSALGNLGTSNTLTNSYGVATTTFTTNKISGNATIRAALTYNGNITNLSYLQNIDHDVPYFWTVTSPTQGSVGTEVWFNVSYTDQWGNIIDNRNPADPDTVSLQIGSVSGTAAFDNNGVYTTSVSQQLSGQGVLAVKVLLDSIAGQNNIHIQPFGAIPDEYPFILGISNGVPASITEVVSPNPPAVPADMAHTITIDYTLYDKYGNPTSGQNISVQTSAGDYYPNLMSNQFGVVSLTYGPRAMAENVTVTATCLGNSSVTAIENVSFYSSAPVSWVISANPQVMPSYDVSNTAAANVTAEVMDALGNPVAGQTVTFSLGSISYDKATDIITSAPTLTSTSAVTNSNGDAIVQFIPGGFSTNTTSQNYNPTATGNCTLTATWNGIPQSVLLSWKNYPYLSAITSVSPATTGVNGTVTVTVSLTGDGWALEPSPSDVVIVTDLSGGLGGAGLLAETQNADKSFVVNASSTMYIGLVSFGDNTQPFSNNAAVLYNEQQATNPRTNVFNPYSNFFDWCLVDPALWNSPQPPGTIINSPPAPYAGSYPWTIDTGYWYFNSYSDATIDSTFTSKANNGALINTINNYQGIGGTDYAAGINAALQLFQSHPDPGYTKAIIIMGDGIPMMAPISPGSLQSYWPSDWHPRSNLGWEDESNTAINAAIDAANRAEAQGITIYAAGFPINGEVDTSTLQSLVSSPNDFFYTPDPDDLTQILQTIEGQIKTQAGVNTQMTLNFQSLNISGVSVSGASALSYVAANPGSTEITWQDGVTNNTDQTDQWNANHALNFNIGTINLGQTWQAIFELNLTQAGNFQLFGNQPGNPSTVVFNNGTSFMTIPPVFVTAINNITNSGSTIGAIQLSNFVVTKSGVINDFVPLQWNTTYPGIQTATERLYYSMSYQPPQTCGNTSSWVQFDQQSVPPGQSTETSTFDVRTLPAGTYYECVLAQAQDAYQASAETSSSTQVKTSSKAYIQLQ